MTLSDLGVVAITTAALMGCTAASWTSSLSSTARQGIREAMPAEDLTGLSGRQQRALNAYFAQPDYRRQAISPRHMVRAITGR